jgi:hypothetical protein
MGRALIPCGQHRRPVLESWLEFQKRLPSEEELASWKHIPRRTCWAQITGAISGVITLDGDGAKGVATFERLGLRAVAHRKTPSDGLHVDFVHPGWYVSTLNSKSKRELGRRYPGLDIRADGGYAVVLGSCLSKIDKKLHTYRWLRDPEPYSLDTLPEDLREFLGLLQAPAQNGFHSPSSEGEAPEADPTFIKQLVDLALQAVWEGRSEQEADGRNNVGFLLACDLRDLALESEQVREIMLTDFQPRVPATDATGGNIQPYTEREVLASIASAFSRPRQTQPPGKRIHSLFSRSKTKSASGERTNQKGSAGKTSSPVEEGFAVDRPQWPLPLKEAAYYGLAGEIVRAIEPDTESDPAALLLQTLLAFGSVIGHHSFWMVEATLHYLNLFVVLAGKTSKARKGTALNRVLQLFSEVDLDWYAKRKISGLSTGEGLIHKVRDPTYNAKDEETDPGEPDKRLLVVEPEFARVLKVSEREAATLPSILRAAWDSDPPLETVIKNSPDRATGAHISLIGHITESELRSTLSTNHRLNGFANRFLWCCVQRSKLLPRGGEPMETATKLDLLTRLKSVVEFARRPRQLQMSDRAWELWEKVYPKLSEGARGMLGAVTDRGEAQVRRLASIYALLDERTLVQEQHLRAALEVWRYAFESARFLFGEAILDRKADKIRRALEKAGTAGMSRNRIRKEVFQQNLTSDEVAFRLQALLDAGEVRTRLVIASDGKKIEMWYSVKADSGVST